MSEPDKQQFGDGGGQWGEAARNLANAAKELGKEGAKTAAAALPRELPIPPPPW